MRKENSTVTTNLSNLAIRYNHRISTDNDIYFPHIIGKAGYERIKVEVENFMAHVCLDSNFHAI
ncbi:hypothetical protein [Sphingobacterium paludis]|uniref:hypothetical protein n=1 Tax=Sphingobacterium paludis TaxID=1476465 RepID=UPI00105F7D1E|nr:hypothetical protein [Sphingobacterium paludis]